MKKYTDELNTLILISLLKKHGIKKVIASPGTTNMSFIGSIQNDPFFEIYSCVDERSACYMACGMAEESGEPVVISCTGATASRNYIPGLTEAYYRKLPILAITSGLHLGKIGQNVPQVMDRTQVLKDIVTESVQIPSVYSDEDKWAANVAINKAILALTRNGGGPAHINLVTIHSPNFLIDNLPNERLIKRIEISDKLPKLDEKKIGIFVGAHSKWNDSLSKTVDEFCNKYNAVVLCDYTSNYFGKYKILPNIICDQEQYNFEYNDFDIIIDIGNVSGAYVNFKTKEVWRVNPDGEIRDTYKKLTYVFEMPEQLFFEKYIELESKVSNINMFDEWKKVETELIQSKNDIDLPFSNIWVSNELVKKIEDESTLHLAILNSLRSWNYCPTNKKIYGYSNTGGFGIDGILSTLIGASLCDESKNYYAVIGDLAFFYDLNSLGNRNIRSNLRILLVNNGCGTEFHNYSHQGATFGEEAGKFIAADGHFGNKSLEIVKNYVQNLGFEYISASNKEEFLLNIDKFCSKDKCEKPLVFEIFTDSVDESLALKQVRNIKKSLAGSVKNTLKNKLSPKTKEKIKKVLKTIKK